MKSNLESDLRFVRILNCLASLLAIPLLTLVGIYLVLDARLIFRLYVADY